jgi:hypothetical protein
MYVVSLETASFKRGEWWWGWGHVSRNEGFLATSSSCGLRGAFFDSPLNLLVLFPFRLLTFAFCLFAIATR